MSGQSATDAGPTGAGLLYDARRSVYYARPALRGRLHLLCFWASLASGPLLVARARCSLGSAAPTAGVLLLAGGLLYIAGALSYHRRWPNPFPSVFGYHEVFHVYVCTAAVCQFATITRFAG